jgi:hypothetical protein
MLSFAATVHAVAAEELRGRGEPAGLGAGDECMHRTGAVVSTSRSPMLRRTMRERISPFFIAL